ncbi:hypothetical protein, partial [Escherichia coli]|uniref:hypothetical protein n=1 Tax=Escherichia coli TaxID=562 RepID=UPI00207C2EBC
MLPSETMIWQPEFTDKTLSRKPGAVHLVRRPPRHSLQNPAFYPQQSSLHPKRQNMYRQHVPL